MAIVNGDQYLESLVKFLEANAEKLLEGTFVLKLNPMSLRYVHSRLEALAELEILSAGAPVDYLRAYVSDLGDHRALEQLRRILRLLPCLKLVSDSVLPPSARDPTPLYLFPFGRLKVLELRGCDLSTSAAKGLLELRLSLEKLICHNSTDALRHVFASRIAEIKDSHQWKRLSVVSCACNGLVVMDESLQLLPAVETLDLSRNKFSRANNLWKCIKLKHLDLGFNSLRSIESFNEVSSQIVKLVLRNNALTKLCGIEHLKSLEGLDLSYNIISNLSEIEILARLPSLQNLWLEGNPLCCARWFRAQVFSLFSQPQKLNLDEKQISACELWERQIIVASRRKQPSSFGFYSPAIDNTGPIFTKRKRLCRLVNFESEEQRPLPCSEQGSASGETEIRRVYESGISDEEGEIEELVRKIELMKREYSGSWLLEFMKWMNQTTDDTVDGCKLTSSTLCNTEGFHLDDEEQEKDRGKTFRDIPISIQSTGDESTTIILNSDPPSVDGSATASDNCMDRTVRGNSVTELLEPRQEEPRIVKGELCAPLDARNMSCTEFAVQEKDDQNKMGTFLLPAINVRMGSSSSLSRSGSPPHYQDSVLHRRNDLEEEFLYMQAESFSIASSESSTSCSQEEPSKFVLSASWDNQPTIDII